MSLTVYLAKPQLCTGGEARREFAAGENTRICTVETRNSLDTRVAEQIIIILGLPIMQTLSQLVPGVVHHRSALDNRHRGLREFHSAAPECPRHNVCRISRKRMQPYRFQRTNLSDECDALGIRFTVKQSRPAAGISSRASRERVLPLH